MKPPAHKAVPLQKRVKLLVEHRLHRSEPLRAKALNVGRRNVVLPLERRQGRPRPAARERRRQRVESISEERRAPRARGFGGRRREERRHWNEEKADERSMVRNDSDIRTFLC